jgi:hypothetical protein
MVGKLYSLPTVAPQGAKVGRPRQSFKERVATQRLQLTTEYPANGSFSFHMHTAFLLCIKPSGEPEGGNRKYGQASRLISIGKLNASRRLHTRPIDLVIFQEPLGIL